MSDDGQQPIVVKRIKKGGGATHGGAWKIAYADFVTAMMAFFLLMWLLGSVTEGDLKGIADYFNAPLKVAMAGGSGSGDSSSIVNGGGEDLTRSYGQHKRSDDKDEKRTFNLKALPADRNALEQTEAKRLNELKTKIEGVIENSASLKQFKGQMKLDITTEGLRIQIVDEQNRPMFDSASAELKPYTREILHEVGRALNGVDNRISLSGHTDATPFFGGEKGFGNWELSTERANASRRELIAGGMSDAKLIRVVGLASALPYDKDDPFAAINRRISIIVLNRRTEEDILRDGKLPDPETAPGMPAPAPATVFRVPAPPLPGVPMPAPAVRR
jgi:chemotaxis protein MotB